MLSVLIAIGAGIGHLLIGALVSRMMSMSYYRWARDITSDVRFVWSWWLLLTVLLWPLLPVALAVTWLILTLRSIVTGPLVDHEAKREEARAKLSALYKQHSEEKDPDNKEIIWEAYRAQKRYVEELR